MSPGRPSPCPSPSGLFILAASPDLKPLILLPPRTSQVREAGILPTGQRREPPASQPAKTSRNLREREVGGLVLLEHASPGAPRRVLSTFSEARMGGLEEGREERK